LAIDTSTTWCSVALSLGEEAPLFRHELVSAGASQIVLPWVEALLQESHLQLQDLDAIAIGIGPGAFTGVRLGVAVVQGLATASDLAVLPVTSLDAIAAQCIRTSTFEKIKPKYFVIAIDARMDEIYWAKYEAATQTQQLAKRMGDIHLSKPEDIDLTNIELLAGSALQAYGDRLFSKATVSLSQIGLDPEIQLSALGILDCARQTLKDGGQRHVRELEPLYVRDKVALTTQERQEAFK
jgi:tRNA threonylcarbamoyladenosine biosynthesis protein TsaB